MKCGKLKGEIKGRRGAGAEAAFNRGGFVASARDGPRCGEAKIVQWQFTLRSLRLVSASLMTNRALSLASSLASPEVFTFGRLRTVTDGSDGPDRVY